MENLNGKYLYNCKKYVIFHFKSSFPAIFNTNSRWKWKLSSRNIKILAGDIFHFTFWISYLQSEIYLILLLFSEKTSKKILPRPPSINAIYEDSCEEDGTSQSGKF